MRQTICKQGSGRRALELCLEQFIQQLRRGLRTKVPAGFPARNWDNLNPRKVASSHRICCLGPFIKANNLGWYAFQSWFTTEFAKAAKPTSAYFNWRHFWICRHHIESPLVLVTSTYKVLWPDVSSTQNPCWIHFLDYTTWAIPGQFIVEDCKSCWLPGHPTPQGFWTTWPLPQPLQALRPRLRRPQAEPRLLATCPADWTADSAAGRTAVLGPLVRQRPGIDLTRWTPRVFVGLIVANQNVEFM